MERVADPAQTAPSSLKARSKSEATLCTAYGVFGLSKDVSNWQTAPLLPIGKVEFTSSSAIEVKFKAEVLGNAPRHADQEDPSTTKLLHAAMRSSYPNDVEICRGDPQPSCMNHSFVLQQSSSTTVYGVSLIVWSKADEKRAAAIHEIWGRSSRSSNSDETPVYWIPYALCFLSPYPLFNLLGSYVRAMWIHWSKSTNLFHSEEVSRILSFPAPRLQDLVRIEMKDYALVYQFPSHPSSFQNFDMWPLFSCLTIPQVVGILETALSPEGRVIFVAKYPAILNIACESIRLACRIVEWSGLYVPIVHCSTVKNLVEQRGPYMLGITRECQSLFSAPPDAVVVDLDNGTIKTHSPPLLFAKTSSRQKFIRRLTDALDSHLEVTGVPQHLKDAYAGGQLTPEGQVVAGKGRIEVIVDPHWWDQTAVLAACDHVCRKLGTNTGFKALTSGATKKPSTTKISTKALQELEREKASNGREIEEAWLSYCMLKSQMASVVSKLTKKNDFLVDELTTWKAQFEKFQAVAQDLTKQSLELKAKIEAYKLENRTLTQAIKQHVDENTALRSRLDTAVQTKEDLTKEKQYLKEKMRVLKTQNSVLLQQRDEVESVLTALRQLIESQPAAVVSIIEKKPLSKKQSTTSIAKGSNSQTMSQTDRTHLHSKSPSSQSSTPSGPETKQVIIETSRDFEKALNMDSQNESYGARRSSSHLGDADLREKTKDITDLINKITADCIAAIDRINGSIDDDNDGPFSPDNRRSASFVGDREYSATSVASQKRASEMTDASEALKLLDLEDQVAAPIPSVRAGKTHSMAFTRTKVHELRI